LPIIEIAPSILAADFRRLGEQVEDALTAAVRRIHVDVMDGRFVPNISMGALVFEALRPLAERFDAVLEAHLMVEEPDRFLADFARAGATAITVHSEASTHLHRTVQVIRDLGARPGVALNPATPLVMLEEILPAVDLVLVMSVNPGFGGQNFIRESLAKVRRLRALLVERGLGQVVIEVDGGINTKTICDAATAGATIAVAGSAVFNDRASVAANLDALRTAAVPPCGAGRTTAG